MSTTVRIGMTIDCPDPEELATFWGPFLGYERRSDQPHEADGTYATLYKPSGIPGIPSITFQRVPEPKTGKSRAHLDLFVDSAEQMLADMIAAGATLIETTEAEQWTVRILQDPAGNEFCLIGAA